MKATSQTIVKEIEACKDILAEEIVLYASDFMTNTIEEYIP